MTDRSILTKQLARLKARRVPRAELYDLLHEFGEAGFVEAAPEVAKFLHHRFRNMRYIAVMVLALHWYLVEYRDEYERLAKSDPKIDVRRIAVSGLGAVLKETRDPRATRFLLEKLRDNSEDGSVREASYEALLDLWFPHAQLKPQRLRKLEEAIEENLASMSSMQTASVLPGPLRTVEFESRRKKRRGEERGGLWAAHVDWDLVMAIERGEIS